MENKLIKKHLITASITTLMAFSQSGYAATGTVAIQWNEAALQAIRDTHPGPPIVARALAIVDTCMFDAWAAYDAKAKGTRFGQTLRRPRNERTNENKEKAISYAAHACLVDLFPSETPKFNALMENLGYAFDTTSDISKAAGIGNVAAKAVLDYRHHDGSNQLGDLNPGAYSDYTGYTPINTPTSIVDPNHWQPLQVETNTQKYITPHWGNVVPYALKSGSQFRKITPPPADYFTEPERYELQAQQILEYSSHLTDEKKVIAEYWADGPHSELPPGHWALFAAYVSERDHHTIDQDVKLLFALSNAILDASIASWDAKRYYDYVRPVTAIHFLFSGKTVESWQGSIDGADWKPYQAASVVTPPFPEYYSGHSIFSAAGAETLKLFTKSDHFGFSVSIPAGSSRVEPGIVPANDTVLYWATFSDAADEAGVSRRYGGIHFIDGDLVSRKIGRLVGRQAWEKSLKYFNEGHENHESDDHDHSH
ncbi:MAG: vanadium-dependent haloperoxidase [Methylococcaceae bacterium]|nr:vanadium-dependent haloperoxidase [Methylococcaceae bacterium]